MVTKGCYTDFDRTDFHPGSDGSPNASECVSSYGLTVVATRGFVVAVTRGLVVGVDITPRVVVTRGLVVVVTRGLVVVVTRGLVVVVTRGLVVVVTRGLVVVVTRGLVVGGAGGYSACETPPDITIPIRDTTIAVIMTMDFFTFTPKRGFR
jgi:hypothetical protein